MLTPIELSNDPLNELKIAYLRETLRKLQGSWSNCMVAVMGQIDVCRAQGPNNASAFMLSLNF